jgi:DUF4097 and DUF4098 domain-containing protein YvlB
MIMKGRSIALIILSLLLLSVLGLCGLTVFGTYRWVKASGIAAYQLRNDTVSAQVTESHTFPAGKDLALDVNTAVGDITVSAVPGAKEITLQVTKTGWGATDVEAKAVAETLIVDQHQEGSTLVVGFQPTEPNHLTFGTYRSPSASFTIQVPSEIDVTLTTLNGSVTLSGIRGKALLVGTFGSLDVRDVNAGTEAVTLRTSFGEVKAQDITAGMVSVETTSGAVHLARVKAADGLKVSSSFEAIDVTDLTGAGLEITNQNGAVSIKNSTVDGKIQIETSFDKIDLAEVHADGYRLVNQNGEISLNGAQGELELSTSFENILVTNAQDAVLKITNQNGRISFSGSLNLSADHSVVTSFDDVVISIPSTTAVNLDVSTSFGEIQSDIPLTMSGQISEDSWSGKLNGGGKLLKIENQNGSVKIKELK